MVDSELEQLHAENEQLRAELDTVRMHESICAEECERLLEALRKSKDNIAAIYQAMLPHIAGGSEYTGVSGIIRGINELAARGETWRRAAIRAKAKSRKP